MLDRSKKISVCMPVFNGEKYISKQVNSILKQLDIDDELIISDDSSTDESLNIVKSFNDPRIKILEANRFKSPIYNLENALHSAKGDYIYLADQDDIWMDKKVEIMNKYLNEFDLVVSDCFVIDKDENIINDSFFELRNSGTGFLHNLLRNSYLGCCMAFNRKILDIAVPFPSNIPMHDIWLGMIGELFGKTFFCEEKLIKYRRHGNNASPTGETSKYTFVEKFGFRKNLLFSLLKRKVTPGNQETL